MSSVLRRSGGGDFNGTPVAGAGWQVGHIGERVQADAGPVGLNAQTMTVAVTGMIADPAAVPHTRIW